MFLNDPGLIRQVREFILSGINFQSKSFSGEIRIGGDYQSKNIQAVFQTFMALRGIIEFTDKDITDGIRK